MVLSELLQLPAETRLQIFSNLPVKGILRMRSVCRNFAELIDNPENHALLLAPAEDRAVCCLQDFVKHVIYYNEDTNFLEALQRYVAHRGILVESTIFTWTSMHFLSFAGNWLYRHLDKQPRYMQDAQTFFAPAQIMRLAWCCVKTHVVCHLPGTRYVTSEPPFAGTDAEVWDMATFLGKTRSSAAKYLDMSEDVLQQIYSTLSDTPGGVLDGNVYHGDPTVDAVPTWPLTVMQHAVQAQHPFHIGPPETSQSVKPEWNGCCNIRQLTTLFARLSKIPDGPYFAYCVRSEWAYERVKDALAGNTMSRLEKAAVLEGLFIF